METSTAEDGDGRMITNNKNRSQNQSDTSNTMDSFQDGGQHNTNSESADYSMQMGSSHMNSDLNNYPPNSGDQSMNSENFNRMNDSMNPNSIQNYNRGGFNMPPDNNGDYSNQPSQFPYSQGNRPNYPSMGKPAGGMSPARPGMMPQGMNMMSPPGPGYNQPPQRMLSGQSVSQQTGPTPTLNQLLQTSNSNPRFPSNYSEYPPGSKPGSDMGSAPLPYTMQQNWNSNQGRGMPPMPMSGSSPYRNQNDVNARRTPSMGGSNNYPNQGGQFPNQQQFTSGPRYNMMPGQTRPSLPNQSFTPQQMHSQFNQSGNQIGYNQPVPPSSQSNPMYLSPQHTRSANQSPNSHPSSQPGTPQSQSGLQQSPVHHNQTSPVPTNSENSRVSSKIVNDDSDSGTKMDSSSQDEGDNLQDNSTSTNVHPSLSALRRVPSPAGSTGSRSNTPASLPGNHPGSPMPPRPPSGHIDGQGRLSQSPMATQGFNQQIMPPPIGPNQGPYGAVSPGNKLGGGAGAVAGPMPGHFPQYNSQYPGNNPGNYGRNPNMPGGPNPGVMPNYQSQNMYNGPSPMGGGSNPMYNNMPRHNMPNTNYSNAYGQGNMGMNMPNQYGGFNNMGPNGPAPGPQTMNSVRQSSNNMTSSDSQNPAKGANAAAAAAQAAMIAAANSAGNVRPPPLNQPRMYNSPSMNHSGPIGQLNHMTVGLGAPPMNNVPNNVNQQPNNSSVVSNSSSQSSATNTSSAPKDSHVKMNTSVSSAATSPGANSSSLHDSSSTLNSIDNSRSINCVIKSEGSSDPCEKLPHNADPDKSVNSVPHSDSIGHGQGDVSKTPVPSETSQVVPPGTENDQMSNSSDSMSSNPNPASINTPITTQNKMQSNNNQIPQDTVPTMPPVSMPTFPDEPPEKKKKKSGTIDLSKLYEMGSEPDRKILIDKLLSFNEDKGVPITGMPSISKQPLDLYKLYNCVKERGGMIEVNKLKKWKEICTIVNIGSSASAAFTLKKNYIKYLFAFECQYDRGGMDPQPILAQMEAALAQKREQKHKRAPSPAGSQGSSQDAFRPPSTPNSQGLDPFSPGMPQHYMQNDQGMGPMGGMMSHPGMMNPHNMMSHGHMGGMPHGMMPGSNMMGPNSMMGHGGNVPPNAMMGPSNMMRPNMMPGNMSGNMPNSMSGNMPNSMSGNMHNSMGGNMHSSMSGNMPNSMSGNMPNSMSGNTPNSMSGNMPSSMSGNMPNSMSGNMPNSVGGNMPNSMSGNMPDSMRGNMPDSMRGNIPDSMRGNMPNAMSGNMPDSMRGNMPDSMRGNMPDSMRGNMPDSMRGNMPDSMRGNMPDSMRGNMPDSMRGNMPDSVRGNMPNAMSGNMPDSIRGNMPDSVRGNMPNAMSGNMPDSVRGNMPNAMDGTVPNSMAMGNHMPFSGQGPNIPGSMTGGNMPNSVIPGSVQEGVQSSSMSGNMPNTSVPGNMPNTSMSGNTVNTSMSGNTVNTSMSGNTVNTSMSGNMPNTSMSGNMPNTSMSGNMPNTSMSGNMPNTTMPGNFPNSSMAGNIPNPSMATNMPNSSTSGSMTTSTANMPVSTMSGNMPNSSMPGSLTHHPMQGKPMPSLSGNMSSSSMGSHVSGNQNSSTGGMIPMMGPNMTSMPSTSGGMSNAGNLPHSMPGIMNNAMSGNIPNMSVANNLHNAPMNDNPQFPVGGHNQGSSIGNGPYSSGTQNNDFTTTVSSSTNQRNSGPTAVNNPQISMTMSSGNISSPNSSSNGPSDGVQQCSPMSTSSVCSTTATVTITTTSSMDSSTTCTTPISSAQPSANSESVSVQDPFADDMSSGNRTNIPPFTKMSPGSSSFQHPTGLNMPPFSSSNNDSMPVPPPTQSDLNDPYRRPGGNMENYPPNRPADYNGPNQYPSRPAGAQFPFNQQFDRTDRMDGSGPPGTPNQSMRLAGPMPNAPQNPSYGGRFGSQSMPMRLPGPQDQYGSTPGYHGNSYGPRSMGNQEQYQGFQGSSYASPRPPMNRDGYGTPNKRYPDMSVYNHSMYADRSSVGNMNYPTHQDSTMGYHESYMTGGPREGSQWSPMRYQQHGSNYMGNMPPGAPGTPPMGPYGQPMAPRHPRMKGVKQKAFPPSVVSQTKKEIPFPPDTIEGIHPPLLKRRRLTSKDLGPIEAWRLMMALKSGLLTESTWALDTLNILLFDDSTVSYFNLSHLPGLLDILLQHFQKCVVEVFTELIDFEDETRASEPTVDMSSETILNGENYTLISRNGKLVHMEEDSKDKWMVQPKTWDKCNQDFLPDDHITLGGGKLNHIMTKMESENTNNLLSKLFSKYHGKHKDKRKVFTKDKVSPAEELISDKDNKMEIMESETWSQSKENNSQNARNNFIKDCKSPEACETNDNNSLEDANNSENKEPSIKMEVDPKSKDECETITENGQENSKPEENESSEMCSDKTETSETISYHEPTTYPKTPAEIMSMSALFTRNKVTGDLEEESYEHDTPPLYNTANAHEELARRCVCISNIFRSLSCIPGNGIELSRHLGLMSTLGKLLLLHHKHLPRSKKHRFEKDDSEADEVEESVKEGEWWWFCLDALRENTLVIFANICGKLKLAEYPEHICFPVLDGLLHWVVCTSSCARDPMPNMPPNSVLSPQRLVLEALCKLCIHDANVDLLLATPPFERIIDLFDTLVKLLANRKEQVTQEFAIVLLSELVQGESSVSRAIALQHQCISLLVDFLETAEQNAHQVAKSQGIGVLQNNPEAMGTSLDMLRRAASILAHLARVEENRTLFVHQQNRLLTLVMSQILDQTVAKILSDVLYECSQLS